MQTANGLTGERPGSPAAFDISVESPIYDSFRAAKVRSMFNVTGEQGSRHEVRVQLPLHEQEWQIGAVIGPSGTGKTTLGRHLFGGGKLHQGFEWDAEKPIIDQIGPDLDFTKVTGALASVGLGTVPSWLRPYQVLSMGEKFRADMARIVIEQPEQIVVDEFTSVVDRQIAQIGAAAFSKAWRRTQGQVVVLACHYDIIDWLQPDWVLDTRYWDFHWRRLRRRPEIALDVYESGSGAAWKFFEPHHYLKLPMPVAPSFYVAECAGVPVAHVCVATGPGLKVARITRLVVMPEWQGAGVGMKFLEYVAQRWLDGKNRYEKKNDRHYSHFPSRLDLCAESLKALGSHPPDDGRRRRQEKSPNPAKVTHLQHLQVRAFHRKQGKKRDWKLRRPLSSSGRLSLCGQPR